MNASLRSLETDYIDLYQVGLDFIFTFPVGITSVASDFVYDVTEVKDEKVKFNLLLR